MDSCWKYSSEILVQTGMTTSYSFCWFVCCTSMKLISCSTTCQRSSVGLRSGNYGAIWVQRTHWQVIITIMTRREGGKRAVGVGGLGGTRKGMTSGPGVGSAWSSLWIPWCFSKGGVINAHPHDHITSSCNTYTDFSSRFLFCFINAHFFSVVCSTINF